MNRFISLEHSVYISLFLQFYPSQVLKFRTETSLWRNHVYYVIFQLPKFELLQFFSALNSQKIIFIFITLFDYMFVLHSNKYLICWKRIYSIGFFNRLQIVNKWWKSLLYLNVEYFRREIFSFILISVNKM